MWIAYFEIRVQKTNILDLDEVVINEDFQPCYVYLFMMLLKKLFFLFSIHQKPECLNEYIVGFEIALSTEYLNQIK